LTAREVFLPNGSAPFTREISAIVSGRRPYGWGRQSNRVTREVERTKSASVRWIKNDRKTFRWTSCDLYHCAM